MAVLGTNSGSAISGSGLTADIQTYDIDRSQPTVDVTKFGDTGSDARNKGSGTFTTVVSIGGFLNDTATGIQNLDGVGVAATFTLATGRAISGTFITRRTRINGSRIGANWAFSGELVGAGALTWSL